MSAQGAQEGDAAQCVAPRWHRMASTPWPAHNYLCLHGSMLPRMSPCDGAKVCERRLSYPQTAAQAAAHSLADSSRRDGAGT